MPSLVVILSGICSGLFIGVSIPTHSEIKFRSWGQEGYIPWNIFGARGGFSLFLGEVVSFLMLTAMVLLVGIGILKFGNAYPLCGSDSATLGVSWMVGAAAGKLGRYFYWRSREKNLFKKQMVLQVY